MPISEYCGTEKFFKWDYRQLRKKKIPEKLIGKKVKLNYKKSLVGVKTCQAFSYFK